MTRDLIWVIFHDASGRFSFESVANRLFVVVERDDDDSDLWVCSSDVLCAMTPPDVGRREALRGWGIPTATDIALLPDRGAATARLRLVGVS